MNSAQAIEEAEATPSPVPAQNDAVQDALFGQVHQLQEGFLKLAHPSKENLFAAFSKAQGEFSTVVKNKTAKVEKDGRLLYSYKYADFADVLNMARPILSKHGLVLTQPLKRRDGKLYLVSQLRMGSEIHEDDGILVPEMLEPQKLGSLLSYYKRIAGCALLGVSAEEDTDAPPPEDGKKTGLPTGLGRKAKDVTKPPESSSSGEKNAHGIVITDDDLPSNMQPVQKVDTVYRRSPEQSKKLKLYIDKCGKDAIKSFVVRVSGSENTDSLGKEAWTEVFKQLDSAVDDNDLKQLVKA